MGISASATQQTQSSALLTDLLAAKAAEADRIHGSRCFLDRRLRGRQLIASFVVVTLSTGFSLAVVLCIPAADWRTEAPIETRIAELVAGARAEEYLAAVRANNGSHVSSAGPGFFWLDCPGKKGKCQCGAKDDRRDADRPGGEFVLPIASAAGGRVRVVHPGYYFIAVQVAARASDGSASCVDLEVSRTRRVPGGAGVETDEVLSEARATLDAGPEGGGGGGESGSASSTTTVLYTSKVSKLERSDELSVLLQCAGSRECHFSVGHASYLSLYLIR